MKKSVNNDDIVENKKTTVKHTSNTSNGLNINKEISNSNTNLMNTNKIVANQPIFNDNVNPLLTTQPLTTQNLKTQR